MDFPQKKKKQTEYHFASLAHADSQLPQLKNQMLSICFLHALVLPGHFSGSLA